MSHDEKLQCCCEFSLCVFQKFQDLRKKNDEMKMMKVPRQRKRRRHKKGVCHDTMKKNVMLDTVCWC